MDAYVMTGGGRGIGPAIAERLAAAGTVLAVELAGRARLGGRVPGSDDPGPRAAAAGLRP